MRILVTGASGFIGQELIKNLCMQHQVFAVIRNTIESNHSISFVKCDLSDPGFISLLPKNIDCVIHLAQSRYYRDFPNSAPDIFRINVSSTVELLEWSRQNQIKKFILASTANVFSPSDNLLCENSEVKPASFYGATKLSAELYARQYQQYFSVDLLRIFTVYGPNQRNMLIANMIEKIDRGETISLSGGVGVNLTPIYVSDVVKVVTSLCSPELLRRSHLFNVCGSDIISLAQIVKIIESELSKKAFVQVNDDKAPSFVGSNIHLLQTLRELRLVTFEQGIATMLSSYSRKNQA